MKTIKFLTILAALGFIFNSCGTAGPEGSQGPQGPTGATGASGTNVTSETFTVTAGDWIADTAYPELDYGTTTSTSLNMSGAMECFYSTDQTNWQQLPWVTTGNAPFFEQSWTYNISFGTIFVQWFNITAGSNIPPSPPSTCYFNVVAIPPAVINRHPNTNWNNSSEVASLPEVKGVLNKSNTNK